MMSNPDRKRLDESSARVGSSPRACDGTPQGCIVKPCNSPVPCGGCCWCLGGCDVDPAPAAEPADHPEFPEDGEACTCGMHFAAQLDEAEEVPFPILRLLGDPEVRRWLARRDEKRDREAVGRVVEAVDALKDLPPEQRPSIEDWAQTINVCRRAILRALAEIEGA